MRTAAQIDAEINRTRACMDTTLGELEQRLSPRELIRDGVHALSRHEAGRCVLRAGDLARRHPVPAAIAVASVIGLLLLARQQIKARN